MAAGSYWVHRGTETTDDAQVEGRIVFVSSRVAGQITRILVQDNERVEKGQNLIQIDRSEPDARLAAAKADVALARAQLRSANTQLTLAARSAQGALGQARGAVVSACAATRASRETVSQAQAATAAADARRSIAELELERSRRLVQSGAVSQAELDIKQTTFIESQAAYQQARARAMEVVATTEQSAGNVQVAQSLLLSADTEAEQVDMAEAAVQAAEARVAQAESAEQLAELNVSYTLLTSPKRGTVSRRTTEEGQMASPDRPLLAIVADKDVWVVANFKEDQLRDMRAGQRVTCYLDTYGSRPFGGYVDSLGGAAGSRFAVLPPDNASGNFVKVVQRIPVLVRLDDAPALALRPGMSATVEVTTR
ncbi:MAG: HlyD family secretion protein [Polyangiaceae bacterium]|jgi:membrane fusion protein (multidrug efflux system)